MSDTGGGRQGPGPAPGEDTWPPGFGLRLDTATRRVEGGTVVVGGAPVRVLRLSATGARLLDRLAAGAPVPPEPGAAALVRRLVDAGVAHPVPDGARPAPETAGMSVVVPVKNNAGGLGRTLAGAGHVRAAVVVDDGSAPAEAEATAAMVAARPPGSARLLRHPRSLGPAAARNTGWRATDGALVAFLDADCEPRPGWLDHLLPHFADPRVGAVAARVVSRGGDDRDPRRGQGLLAAYEARRSPLDLGPVPGEVKPGGRVGYVPSAAMVVRRSALVAVGGFDPHLRVGEDVDLVWRLRRAGWSVRYEPAALVSHPCRPGLGAWVAQRVAYGRSAAPLARRHPGQLAPVVVSPWEAVAWGLAATGRPLAGAAVAAGGAAVVARRLGGLRRPWRRAGLLTARSQVGAGRQLAEASVRAWWPLALVAGVGSRRARPAVLAAAVVPPLVDWTVERPGLPLSVWLGLRLADHLSYGTGLWLGCLAEASPAALLPRRPGVRRGPGPSARRPG